MMEHWDIAFYFGLLGFLEAYAVYRYLNNQLLGRALRNGFGAIVAYAVYRSVATDGVEGVVGFLDASAVYIDTHVESVLLFGFDVSPAYAVHLTNLLGLPLLVGIISIVVYAVYALIQITAVVLPEDEGDNTTPRALLLTLGFDPDDLNQENNRGRTPMTYYSATGNVTMVRYLIAHDADCRKADSEGWFPMCCAAMYGHLEVMTVLFHEGGAQEDIRRVILGSGNSPLRIALIRGHVPVVQWLIWNGALASGDGDGGIDDEIMRRILSPALIHCAIVKWDLDKWRTVLSWAQNAVTAHENSQLFVSGAILFPDDILEIMSDYVAGTQQEVRTLRQLIERLPAFMAEVPVVEEEDMLRQLIERLPAFMAEVPVVEEEGEDE